MTNQSHVHKDLKYWHKVVNMASLPTHSHMLFINYYDHHLLCMDLDLLIGHMTVYYSLIHDKWIKTVTYTTEKQHCSYYFMHIFWFYYEFEKGGYKLWQNINGERFNICQKSQCGIYFWCKQNTFGSGFRCQIFPYTPPIRSEILSTSVSSICLWLATLH